MVSNHACTSVVNGICTECGHSFNKPDPIDRLAELYAKAIAPNKPPCDFGEQCDSCDYHDLLGAMMPRVLDVLRAGRQLKRAVKACVDEPGFATPQMFFEEARDSLWKALDALQEGTP